LLATLAVTGSACWGDRAAPAPTVQDLKAATDCGRKVAVLREWLADIETDGSERWGPLAGRVTLTEPAPARSRDANPYIEVTATEISVDGSSVCVECLERTSTTTANYPDLLRLSSRSSPYDATASPSLSLHHATPWRVTKALLKHIASKKPSVVLVFANGVPRATEPPPSSIDVTVAELTKPSGGDVAKRLSEGPRPEVVVRALDVFRACRHRTRFMDRSTAGLADGVSDCDCQVEIPALQRIVWWQFGRHGGLRVGVPVQLATAAGPGVVTVAALDDEPWSTTYVAIMAAVRAGKAIYIN
jgi:hypothetical protein